MNKLSWWEKRKLAKAAVKSMEDAVVKEAEKQARLNHLLTTDSFAIVIKELFDACTVPGQQVIITLANGNKIEIKKNGIDDQLQRDFEKPFF